jgi:flavin-dependent dehydrogenase
VTRADDGRVDVAVVGAGPAGSATARRLADAGCRVVLVERSTFDGPRVGESLAPSVNALLRDLGVWPRFAALDPVPSYGTCGVWGDARPQRSSHLTSPYGCGWHVDRAAFDGMLADAAAEAGAQVRLGTACTGVARIAGGWSLTLVERRRTSAIEARVVVDATGRGARVARHLGAHRVVFDRLVGLGATFAASDVDDQRYLLVEAAPVGWWYSAPAAGDRMVAMLMTDADLCREARLGTRTAWQDLLSATGLTAARIGGPVVAGPRAVPAAGQRLQREHVDTPWLGVGDAALAVDPISGSGVVRALRTAADAAGCVQALLGSDQRDVQALAAYEAARDRECAAYLTERAAYYGAEQRWAAAPFWRRRHVGGLAATG